MVADPRGIGRRGPHAAHGTTRRPGHRNPILRDLSEVVARAKARGEVGEDVNARFVLQMIVGPLLLSTTFGKKPATSATVEAIAEATARAFAPTP